jgi:hypothetical protein
MSINYSYFTLKDIFSNPHYEERWHMVHSESDLEQCQHSKILNTHTNTADEYAASSFRAEVKTEAPGFSKAMVTNCGVSQFRKLWLNSYHQENLKSYTINEY